MIEKSLGESSSVDAKPLRPGSMDKNSDDGSTSLENSESDEDLVADGDHSDEGARKLVAMEEVGAENKFSYVFSRYGLSGILPWIGVRIVPVFSGLFLSFNFLLFWAIPVAAMGALYRHTFLKNLIQPIYLYLEGHPKIRKFASDNIYSNPDHADFFILLVLLSISTTISTSTMFYVQLTTGSLPAWLIALYYFSWVGIGGTMMGGAYGLSHKEVGSFWLSALMLCSDDHILTGPQSESVQEMDQRLCWQRGRELDRHILRQLAVQFQHFTCICSSPP